MTLSSKRECQTLVSRFTRCLMPRSVYSPIANCFERPYFYEPCQDLGIGMNAVHCFNRNLDFFVSTANGQQHFEEMYSDNLARISFRPLPFIDLREAFGYIRHTLRTIDAAGSPPQAKQDCSVFTT